MPSIVEQRFFSKFDAKGHNNKFWNITLYDNDTVEVHFGPQGKDGQRKSFPSGHSKSGRHGFERYIAEKTGPRKGYIENKVLDGVQSIKTASNNHELTKKAINDIAKDQPDLKKLIEYFASVNAHNLYEASGGKITYDTSTGMFRTTQGVVTLEQIQEARRILDKISLFSNSNDFSSDNFYSTVNPY